MSSSGRFSNMQPLFSVSPDRPKKSKYDISPQGSPRVPYNSVTLDPLVGGASPRNQEYSARNKMSQRQKEELSQISKITAS